MRIAMKVEYDGTRYFGWQSQTFDQLVTLQSEIEKAISYVADHPISIVAAGRTDKGVHASGQIIHFDTHAVRDSRAWVLGVNTHLPNDIAIKWAGQVSEDFHARFSAISRRYQYVILNSSVRSALFHHRAAQVFEPLNIEIMQIAAQHLIGEHDFSAFRAAECQAKTAIREVKKIQIERQGEFIFIEIEANAFLHHMVRNIVGSLVEVGKNIQSPDWMKALLLSKDRTQGGITMPACGLYFVQVYYS